MQRINDLKQIKKIQENPRPRTASGIEKFRRGSLAKYPTKGYGPLLAIGFEMDGSD